MRDRSAPLTEADIASLDWDKSGGLMPAIIQDSSTGQVLMLGYLTPEALEMTLREQKATFFSRRRQELWRKGDTSGHYLAVRAVYADCDDDALLIQADPAGPTCHTGEQSCFGPNSASGPNWLDDLSRIIAGKADSEPESSYTAQLLAEGLMRIGKKVGEEAVELSLAAIGDTIERCIEETADLIYHVALLLYARGYDWADVAEELQRRRGTHTVDA